MTQGMRLLGFRKALDMIIKANIVMRVYLSLYKGLNSYIDTLEIRAKTRVFLYIMDGSN